VTTVTDAVRISGPYAAALRAVLAESYIAETFEQAVAFARVSDAPVATLEGDVLRGAHLVSGGARVEARGILATRREIKELSERTRAEREMLVRAADEIARLEASIAAAAGSLAALQGEQHEREKALVGFDAQLAHEFFQGFANHALVTLHIDNLRGENAHHQCETVFKAFARALRTAVTVDPRLGNVIPSTKGSL